MRAALVSALRYCKLKRCPPTTVRSGPQESPEAQGQSSEGVGAGDPIGAGAKEDRRGLAVEEGRRKCANAKCVIAYRIVVVGGKRIKNAHNVTWPWNGRRHTIQKSSIGSEESTKSLNGR